MTPGLSPFRLCFLLRSIRVKKKEGGDDWDDLAVAAAGESPVNEQVGNGLDRRGLRCREKLWWPNLVFEVFRRRVRRRVRLERESGMGPLRLLLERSTSERRRGEGGDCEWDLAGEVVAGEVDEFEVGEGGDGVEGGVEAVAVEVEEAEVVEGRERVDGAAEVEEGEGEAVTWRREAGGGERGGRRSSGLLGRRSRRRVVGKGRVQLKRRLPWVSAWERKRRSGVVGGDGGGGGARVCGGREEDEEEREENERMDLHGHGIGRELDDGVVKRESVKFLPLSPEIISRRWNDGGGGRGVA
ncbi:hypothetical protein Acr_22g0001700 [Actinidia rufa]|uniref:Uncharacterized protein n=1 Tax=Actinidia rufa TaxID=165716 RepID=A0A7J0GJ51_9ERIC|nr:hypothetical protein Acr_22g0001700 [Actinidia rufa]